MFGGVWGGHRQVRLSQLSNLDKLGKIEESVFMLNVWFSVWVDFEK